MLFEAALANGVMISIRVTFVKDIAETDKTMVVTKTKADAASGKIIVDWKDLSISTNAHNSKGMAPQSADTIPDS